MLTGRPSRQEKMMECQINIIDSYLIFPDRNNNKKTHEN